LTDARRLARALYARASDSRALRRPLDAIRTHPRVRAFARRHLDVLLARGTTWANVDGALRLLAEDSHGRIVFGPWQGDVATELLYWAPFVRWAQEHFALDPARVAVVSTSGAAHWYGDACGAYADTIEAFPGAAVFRPEPVLALVADYRNGTAAPRPLLKRARHLRLRPPGDPPRDGLPDAYVAVALAPSAAFPGSEQNRKAAEDLIRRLSAAGPVLSVDETETLPTQHSILAGATGLVAAYSGRALLGALSGVPVVALRSPDGHLVEPDIDLALRVVSELGGCLTVLDVSDLASLASVLGGAVPASRGRPV
jgi:hypothetical protein